MVKRNYGLDFLKFICAFMVICIHKNFPGWIGSAILPITRIAVPIFFMITGYFYSNTKKKCSEKKQIVKIIRLCVEANALFFIWNIFHSLIAGNSVTEYLYSLLNIKTWLKFVILNESPFSGHLWYLCAVLYVLVIIYYFEKRWDRKYLYPLIPLLLLTDLVFGKYSLLIWKRNFDYIYVRNFLFVGLPYFLLGDIIFRTKKKYNFKLLISLSIFFAITTLLERVVLGLYGLNAGRDHYISTTFLAICIFLLFLYYGNEKNNRCYMFFSNIGCKMSTAIYIIHPILIQVLGFAIAVASTYCAWISIIYSYTAPVCVMISAVVTAWIFECLIKK